MLNFTSTWNIIKICSVKVESFCATCSHHLLFCVVNNVASQYQSRSNRDFFRAHKCKLDAAHKVCMFAQIFYPVNAICMQHYFLQCNKPVLRQQVATCTAPRTEWDKHWSVRHWCCVYGTAHNDCPAFIGPSFQFKSYTGGLPAEQNGAVLPQSDFPEPHSKTFWFHPQNNAVGMCFSQNVLLFLDIFESDVTVLRSAAIYQKDVWCLSWWDSSRCQVHSHASLGSLGTKVLLAKWLKANIRISTCPE